ncbi:LysR substrate-binding domain-containing protein [Primorskyibacter flagellatus]|uniref:DNA-binding transcriptional regulator, LysR family n=1 Tax=Primorskyibacter flagellatus TaxID=1387277 RepID=A0A1W2EED6_9RHOB|nr:LysR substrate-binding domain-containing protein [Primorskyibacter flagellatus]SMD08103.1 DNA-binding transcriptional regulator, LysR family [Primorskyibacter flagellatus]
MKKGNPALPPLDYLLAFEAAAEHMSFVGASSKLNISETAISRKVRLLEYHYNVPLFMRGHRSIHLTPQGERFLNLIKPALQSLRDTSRRIVSEDQIKSVTLAATNSVAALWLMPRLQVFRRDNRSIKIKLVASDDDSECLSDTVDLAILRGNAEWPSHEAQHLFGETVFPVCSPDYLAANPSASSLAALGEQDLIEVSSEHKEWMNWKSWVSEVDASGSEPEQAALFNTYPLAIQAAVDGLGLALGWGHLVDGHLEKGTLVRPMGDLRVRTNEGYYLLRPKKRERFDECQIVEKWLTDVAAALPSYAD